MEAENAGAERIVRFGVIGVGGMGQAHCKGLAKVAEARLAAVCDADPATAEQVGQTYGVPHFTTVRALLRARLCDAVLVATPHPLHGPTVRAAFRAGLHVLCEKPLSDRIGEAERMVAEAYTAKRSFGVMFQRRTEPVFVKALELVRTGAIGRVYRTAMVSPEYRTQAYYDSASWRATWRGEGGGVLMNQAPHVMDLFIAIGGMPCEVYGRTETRLHRIEVEDLAEALLTYPDGGSGYLYCSTNEPPPGQMIEVFGDRGKLTWRDGQLRLVRYEPSVSDFTRESKGMWDKPNALEEPLVLPEGESGHHIVLRNFARHLLGFEPLLVPAEEGLKSLEVANAVWLSAHLRKPVKLPINRRAYDRFLALKRKASKEKQVVGATIRQTDPRHNV